MAALHVASANGDVEIVQLLVEGKANLELTDNSKLTPLFLRNTSRRFMSNPNRGGAGLTLTLTLALTLTLTLTLKPHAYPHPHSHSHANLNPHP